MLRKNYPETMTAINPASQLKRRKKGSGKHSDIIEMDECAEVDDFSH